MDENSCTKLIKHFPIDFTGGIT